MVSSYQTILTQGRRIKMQMQNYAKKTKKQIELEWKLIQKSLDFNQSWTFLHQGSMPNYLSLSHTIHINDYAY